MSDTHNRAILIICAILLASLLAGGVFLGIKLLSNSPRPIEIKEMGTPCYTFTVNLSGAVVSPGSYPATAEDTVLSLLSSAGISEDADINYININIPYKNKSNEPQKVNVNRAEAWLLEALPEIGTTKAKAIVAYRDVHGPYRSYDDLLKVEGITTAVLQRISPLITLGD